MLLNAQQVDEIESRWGKVYPDVPDLIQTLCAAWDRSNGVVVVDDEEGFTITESKFIDSLLVDKGKLTQRLERIERECDDYRTVLHAIERGSFSYRNGNLIARDVLARYTKEV